MSDRKTISESTTNDKATCVITLDEQITNEQYVALLRKISNIHKELDQMSAMIGDIEADRQSKDEDDDCYDLYRIDTAIRSGHQMINEMRDKIRDVMDQ